MHTSAGRPPVLFGSAAPLGGLPAAWEAGDPGQGLEDDRFGPDDLALLWTADTGSLSFPRNRQYILTSGQLCIK